MAGKLYLIPTIIAEGTAGSVIPEGVKEKIRHIRNFLAEDARSARRFFSSLRVFESIESLDIKVLNKDTRDEELPKLLQPALDGVDVGVVSEAGCPGVADPGAKAVFFAHRSGIRVVPLVGPSSLLLALMASGLNGQQFAFHGYLPIDTKEAGKRIQELERESRQRNQTQIFIETPYRNQSLFDAFLKNLTPGTLLTIAIGLTGADEQVQTRTVKEWRAAGQRFAKTPAVFCFLAS